MCVCVCMYIHSHVLRLESTACSQRYSYSPICEHLNALDSCVVNYNKCFGALHRARTKQHLVVLEVLYILLYRLTLCKQNPKHSLNLLGGNYCLTQGVFFGGGRPHGLAIILIFTPLLIHSIYIDLNDF